MGGKPPHGGDQPKLIRKIGGEGTTPVPPLVSLTAIVALVAANYAVFRLLDHNYFRWYLDHGAELALALSLVALAVDLDRDPTLVAANSILLRSWFWLSRCDFTAATHRLPLGNRN